MTLFDSHVSVSFSGSVSVSVCLRKAAKKGFLVARPLRGRDKKKNDWWMQQVLQVSKGQHFSFRSWFDISSLGLLLVLRLKALGFNLLRELVNKTCCSDILCSVLWYCPSRKSVITHRCKKFSDDLTICKKIFLVTQSVKISSSHDPKSKVYRHGTKCLEILNLFNNVKGFGHVKMNNFKEFEKDLEYKRCRKKTG